MNDTEEVEIVAPTKEQAETPETTPKQPMNPKLLVGIVGIVAVMGLCFSFFGGSDTSAEEMRLKKYQGTLTLQNFTESK